MAGPSVFSTIQPSFNAGELSPLLFGRVDLEKYKSGLALARNVYVDYRGCLSNRAGTQYIGTINGPAQPRGIPFTVSTGVSYSVIFTGDGNIQFFSNGVYVAGADLVSPYAVADIPLIKYTQSADVMTLTHPSYPIYTLTRTGPSSFALNLITIGPVVEAPTGVAVSQSGGATNVITYAYVVTAVSSDGKEESLPTIPVAVDGDTLSTGSPSVVTPLVPAISNKITWTASPSAPSLYNVYKAGPIKGQHSAGPEPLPTVFGYIGQSIGNHFVDNNITPDFSKTPPEFQNPWSPGQISQIVPSGGSSYTGYIVTLTFTGGGGTGAAGYGLIDPSTGEVISVIITDPGMNYTTVPTVTDSGANNTTYTVTLGQLTGTYPATSTYFQQRLTYAATDNFPESFVCSVVGKYNNFDTSPITQANDSITASISSTQNNFIKSMVPMSTGLIVLTSGSAFLVTGGSQQSAVSPSSIVALPQASFGASDLPPIPINYTVLYTEGLGFTVRDLTFNFYYQNYVGVDRSILSSHLFFGFTFDEWCFAEAPYRMLHMVRNDGQMVLMTYVPEQELFAWTHYDTNGLFVSTWTVPEGQTNAVYTIVQRYIQGLGEWVYFLERFVERNFNYVVDLGMWFVDAGLSYPQRAPTLTLTPTQVTVGNVTTVTLGFSGSFGAAPGDVVQAYGCQIQLTQVNPASLVGTLLFGTLPTIPNDPFNTCTPLTSGNWTITTPTQTVSGLNYLNGMQVTGIADGVVIPPTTVVNGQIALLAPATSILVGLAYTSQVETLRLTGNNVEEGKRKNIPALTLRQYQSAGLQAGRDFNHLYSQRLPPGPRNPQVRLQEGDIRTIIGAHWDKAGQVAIQQSLPLPMTILADMPEVVPGDTYRG